MEPNNDGLLGSGVRTSLVIALVCLAILGGALLCRYTLFVNRTVVNPEVRQNMVEDPATSIGNKRDFHSALGYIIQVDGNVINAEKQVQGDVVGSDQYNTDRNRVTQLENLRDTAIQGYMQKVDNPDLRRDLDSWMPTNVADDSLPADPNAAISMLNSEKGTLQTAYNHPTNY